METVTDPVTPEDVRRDLSANLDRWRRRFDAADAGTRRIARGDEVARTFGDHPLCRDAQRAHGALMKALREAISGRPSKLPDATAQRLIDLRATFAAANAAMHANPVAHRAYRDAWSAWFDANAAVHARQRAQRAALNAAEGR